MTQVANNYGIVLYELGVEKDTVDTMMDIFSQTEELPKMLQNPVISKEAKHRIIDDIFPEAVRNFLKVLCDRQEVDMIGDIYNAYVCAYNEQHGILSAELTYVMEPDDEQVGQMKEYLKSKYGKAQVELAMHKDPALIGGFVLRVGDMEQDCSMKGRLERLEKRLTWR